MRFGVFVPQGWRMDLVGIDPSLHWGVMDGLARRFDEVEGWESLWVYDHFHTVPKPSGEATHEAWSLMAAFAASTTRIRLGQMCTCMAYRNPAYLAKVAATIDIISGGRVEMGIGAGWYEHEWRAYGYGFPSAGVRLARLDEGVQKWVSMKEALGRLADRPSPTVTGGGAMTGGWEPFGRMGREAIRRSLSSSTGGTEPHGFAWEGEMSNSVKVTTEEAATLQSYPPGFVFAGNKGKQGLQIGNAVPPLLAQRVLERLWWEVA